MTSLDVGYGGVGDDGSDALGKQRNTSVVQEQKDESFTVGNAEQGTYNQIGVRGAPLVVKVIGCDFFAAFPEFCGYLEDVTGFAGDLGTGELYAVDAVPVQETDRTVVPVKSRFGCQMSLDIIDFQAAQLQGGQKAVDRVESGRITVGK